MEFRGVAGCQSHAERAMDAALVQEAHRRLDRHHLFRGRTGSIQIDIDDGVLILSGRLPSFYLKQVLQTDLRQMPGIRRIENRVEVLS